MNARHWFVVNVEAAIFKDDKWLMVRRSEQESHAAGTISFVGGKVEKASVADDILEKTLRREVQEEVGIEIAEKMNYLASSSFIADDGEPVVDVVFLCRYKSGEPRIFDKNEVSAIYWMSTEEILDHPKIIPWTKHVIKAALFTNNFELFLKR